jgi:hypothetical protein
MLDHDESILEVAEAFAAFGAKPLACAEFVKEWTEKPHKVGILLGPWPEYATHAYCDVCGWVGDPESVYITRKFDIMDLAAMAVTPLGYCPAGECIGLAYLGYGPWTPSPGADEDEE